ncbi:MAG: hypothetical protein QM528_04570 [Phycisphaerales bacterium]|nr:hypothetical protein [Phycisphaerales bacterium]
MKQKLVSLGSTLTRIEVKIIKGGAKNVQYPTLCTVDSDCKSACAYLNYSAVCSSSTPCTCYGCDSGVCAYNGPHSGIQCSPNLC